MSAILLLAAGASVRLGRPKQLLRFRGKTLLEHSVSAALAADATHRLVVLGARFEQILPETQPIESIVNTDWAEGMASSVRLGLRCLLDKDPELPAVAVMLCDQPFVTPELLNQLLDTQQQTAAPIVASAYGDTLGVPAVFARETFPQLLSLQGDRGAKTIFPDYAGRIASVPFPEGSMDIDTLEDYNRLLSEKS